MSVRGGATAWLVGAGVLVAGTACEERISPVEIGSIEGQVTIEGHGIDGVTVSLSTGASTSSLDGGRFSFSSVSAGTHTVTIGNLPADASFSSTSQPATISTNGQTATVNFSGTYVRTAGIIGLVTVEGTGQNGVAVRISGTADLSVETDVNGQYAFPQLRAGTYRVDISDFGADVSFEDTSRSVTLGVGENEAVYFRGTYIRTASIIGSVTVEGTGLSGITVRISGHADQATHTDANGQYAFTQLRAGTYTVEVSDFGTDVDFSHTRSQNVTLGVGETVAASFDGTYIRTAGIIGRVAVESSGLLGVTVSLSGIESRTDTTDAAGRYSFADMRDGEYMVSISGYDAEEYEFEQVSWSGSVALGQSVNVPFDGIRRRTAGIRGQVSVEGHGIADVAVALSGVATMTDTTNAEGQYVFSGLDSGTYTVTISGYATDAYFVVRSSRRTLGAGETANVNFSGTYIRTASIIGSVTVEGTGLSGATVRISADHTDQATQTDANGQYAFAQLRAGTYTVEVSDFGDNVVFSAPSQSVTLRVGETGAASFDGTRAR